MGRLNGKVALVTGAAHGIGAAIARAFVDEGARHVCMSDIDDARGQDMAAALGGAACYARLDVREENDWSAVTASLLANSVRSTWS